MKFTSKTFSTQKEMEIEKVKIVEEICGLVGENRESFRLPQGLIMLRGKTAEGIWINLTNVIGDYREKIKSSLWSEYRLETMELEVTRK